VEWMNGEESSNDSATPFRGSGKPQEEKHQDTVETVLRDIDEKMRTCVASKQLHIQHVRDPGERDPVRRVNKPIARLTT